MTITLDWTAALRLTDDAVRARIRCQPDGQLPAGPELWHAAAWLRTQIHDLGSRYDIDPLDLSPRGKAAAYQDQRGHRLAHRWLLGADVARDPSCCADCPRLMLKDLISVAAGLVLTVVRGRIEDALALWETAAIMEGLIPPAGDPPGSPEFTPRQPAGEQL